MLAAHLRCMNHMRQNVKDKLRNLRISQGVMREFLDDIFGKRVGSHFEAGLVDAKSESAFRTALEGLKCRWNNLERSCSSGSTDPQFHSWFCKYKAEDIIKCALPSVRVRAGVDSQCLFTTNSSESLNRVIKEEVEWKENKLPNLISHLHKLTMRHHSEMEKAVISRGEWCLCPQYSALQVEESEWFGPMEDEQKQKHMKKVLSTQVIIQRSSRPNSSSILSVPVESAVTTLPSISSSTLDGIWKKATLLVQNRADHILSVPWLSDPKARLVNSPSSPHQPHTVTAKANSTYVCGPTCQMYKGYSICSHVVAVAEVNGDLFDFLKAIEKQYSPNLTAIASAGFSAGAGRKSGVPKRKRKTTTPIESRSVRPCLQSPSTSSLSAATTCAPPQTSTPSIPFGAPTAPVSCGYPTLSTASMVGPFPLISAPTQPVIPSTVVTSPLLPTTMCTGGAFQLPVNTFSPVSSNNQQGGQVIVNGTGLNLNI